MRNINLSLDTRDIALAMKELRRVEENVKHTADAVCEETANFIADSAREKYSEFSSPVDNPQATVEVHPYKTGHGFTVVATGEPVFTHHSGGSGQVGNSILFLEFGAGVGAGSGHPLAKRLGATEGSFSKTVGTGEFAETGKWHVKRGEQVFELKMLPGTRAMYRASREGKAYLSSIMKGLFK